MSLFPSSDKLAETRQVTVILRLVVDRDGRLQHGEVVNIADNSNNRFKDWDGLTLTLRSWLSNRSQGNLPD